jgi:hypothetical protein
MSAATEVIIDGLNRVKDNVHAAVDGLSRRQLADRLDDKANSIAWLVWHLSGVQDDHVSDVAGTTQVWISAGPAGSRCRSTTTTTASGTPRSRWRRSWPMPRC